MVLSQNDTTVYQPACLVNLSVYHCESLEDLLSLVNFAHRHVFIWDEFIPCLMRVRHCAKCWIRRTRSKSVLCQGLPSRTWFYDVETCVDAFEKPQWIVSGNNDQKNLHLCKFQLLEFRLGYIVWELRCRRCSGIFHHSCL